MMAGAGGTEAGRSLMLSVAMCTYNGAVYLNEQLISIADQTRPPDELVVFDDRSDDGSERLVADFARGAPFPVRLYVNEERLGTTKNFERAIGSCDGDVIALSDQDDVWLPRKLERLMGVFASSPGAGAAFSDAEVVDETLVSTGRLLWRSERFGPRRRSLFGRGRGVEVLLKRNVVTGATLAFRAANRSLLLPIPDSWMHDAWIALITAAASCIVCIPEPLILYRQHPGSQIGTGRRGFGERFGKARMEGQPAYADLARRYTAALERLRSLGGKRELEGVASMLEEKVEHLGRRGSLPEGRLSRLPTVVMELVTRKYHRYSNGFRSALRDVFL